MDALDALAWVFGLPERASDYGFIQLIARALIMYVAALALVRMGKNRFLGKSTAFDVVFGFVFGSMLSRGINGTGPLFPTMAAGAAMLGLHWLFGFIAVRVAKFDRLVNGDPILLVEEGREPGR